MTTRPSVRAMMGRTLALVLATVALAACEKNAVQDITGSLPDSRIRFFNFGVNAPQVHFWANNAKVTATTSATGVESTVGVAYGAVASSGFYSAIDPGQYQLSGRITATVDKELPIATVTTTLAPGKNYSFYMSGLYNTTSKTVDAFVVEDNFSPAIDYTQAQVRYVNAIFNSTPTTLVARNQTTGDEITLGAAVAYQSASTFVNVPAGLYDLTARVQGATAPSYTRVGVSFVNGRVYTITARGDITVTGTTAVNRPFLDNTLNR
jgi:hypothetical protein